MLSVLLRREFLARVASEKARSSNMNCEVITTVKHDKSEPVVDITYGENDPIAFIHVCVCVFCLQAAGVFMAPCVVFEIQLSEVVCVTDFKC